MKILVVGGSRGIGKKIVEESLARGHTVTAFSRNPAKLDIEHPNLRLAAGNALDPSSVKQAVRGKDAVICALGLPTRKAIGPPLARRSYALSSGTKNAIEAMEAAGINRFICVTAIGAGESVRQCTLVARLCLRHVLRWLFKEKDKQEELMRNSGLDWTIIRPTALTNGRKKGAKVGENLHSGILTQVSRADAASEILNMLDDRTKYRKAYVISYDARFGDSLRWTAGYFGIG